MCKPLFPSDVKKLLSDKAVNPTEAQKVIDTLVNINLLRYNADGELVWHSRFVEAEIKALYSRAVR